MKIALRVAKLLACLALAAAGAAWAQNPAANYPNKPVRWIVPFPPGASNDLIARLIGQKLTDAWGQQFVIDNRPGAGGSVGAETVARAAPDGYSLIIVANPSFPPKNGKELVDYAKANPGKVNWGSSGPGSSLHIGLAVFQAATGIDVVHVPYKGAAPALTDVVGGQIHLMYTTTVTGEVQIKAGRVKVLGVADAKRTPVLPDVPTLAEQGIRNAEANVWFGASAPARTPRPIIDKLNREINKALDLVDVKQRLDQLGLVVAGGSPEKFDAFIKSEAERLAKLIKDGAVQVE